MTDNELLDHLEAALVRQSATTSPPAARVEDLHRAIAATRLGDTPPRPRPARGRRFAATAACALALLGGIMLVVVRVTEDNRVAAPPATLAVDVSALLDVLASRDGLERALERDDAAAVASESERLRTAMIRLDAGTAARLGPALTELLDRSDAYLDRLRGTEPSVSTDATTSAPSTTRPSTANPTLVTTTTPVTTAAPVVAPTARPPAPTVVVGSPVAAGIPEPDDDSGHGEGDADNSNSGPGGGDGEEPEDDHSGHGDSD